MDRFTREQPRADKVAVVEEVAQRFADAEAVVLTEYRGLDVGQMADLRGALLATDSLHRIYKNSLVRLAADGTTPDGFVELLVGPTSLTFTGKDPAAAAKAIVDFAKANNALVVKGGILAGSLLDAKQVRELAALPPRVEVLSQLAAGMAAGPAALASMMNSLTAGFAGLLTALADTLPPAPDPDPAPTPDPDPAAESATDEPAAAAADPEPDPAPAPDPDPAADAEPTAAAEAEPDPAAEPVAEPAADEPEPPTAAEPAAESTADEPAADVEPAAEAAEPTAADEPEPAAAADEPAAEPTAEAAEPAPEDPDKSPDNGEQTQ